MMHGQVLLSLTLFTLMGTLSLSLMMDQKSYFRTGILKQQVFFDMALGGSSMVIAIFDGFVEEHGKALFLGESKIAYILNKHLIIQSLVTGNILFRHGIPKDEYYDGGYSVCTTLDGARVVILSLVNCMVWDVGDL